MLPPAKLTAPENVTVIDRTSERREEPSFTCTLAMVAGATTVSVAAFVGTLPPEFVNTARYCQPFWLKFGVREKVSPVAPLMLKNGPPPWLTCH